MKNNLKKNVMTNYNCKRPRITYWLSYRLIGCIPTVQTLRWVFKFLLKSVFLNEIINSFR